MDCIELWHKKQKVVSWYLWSIPLLARFSRLIKCPDSSLLPIGSSVSWNTVSRVWFTDIWVIFDYYKFQWVGLYMLVTICDHPFSQIADDYLIFDDLLSLHNWLLCLTWNWAKCGKSAGCAWQLLGHDLMMEHHWRAPYSTSVLRSLH